MVVVCSGCGGSSGGDCVGVVEMMMLVSVWCTGSGDGDGGLGVEMAEIKVVAYNGEKRRLLARVLAGDGGAAPEK
ncbi:hypothetical protein Tco_1580070 [Tanacetum coccineum]